MKCERFVTPEKAKNINILATGIFWAVLFRLESVLWGHIQAWDSAIDKIWHNHYSGFFKSHFAGQFGDSSHYCTGRLGGGDWVELKPLHPPSPFSIETDECYKNSVFTKQLPRWLINEAQEVGSENYTSHLGADFNSESIQTFMSISTAERNMFTTWDRDSCGLC